jgi:hypothetical protein
MPQRARCERHVASDPALHFPFLVGIGPAILMYDEFADLRAVHVQGREMLDRRPEPFTVPRGKAFV